jgi:hypothetical protein
MNSKAISEEIRGRVWPMLKAQGFDLFTTRTAWRDTGDKIDVVNFQSFNAYNASILGVTPFSFAVNLGSFLKYIPPTWPPKVKDGRLTPEETECQFRGNLLPTLAQVGARQSNVWSVDEQGRNLLWCIQDVVQQLPIAIAWFSRLGDRSEVLSVLLGHDEDMDTLWGFGGRSSPLRSYLTGYVALAVGNQNLARQKLQEAVKSNSYTALFASVEGAVNRAM